MKPSFRIISTYELRSDIFHPFSHLKPAKPSGSSSASRTQFLTVQYSSTASQVEPRTKCQWDSTHFVHSPRVPRPRRVAFALAPLILFFCCRPPLHIGMLSPLSSIVRARVFPSTPFLHIPTNRLLTMMPGGLDKPTQIANNARETMESSSLAVVSSAGRARH